MPKQCQLYGVQNEAALTSAASFSIGAAAPLALVLVFPSAWIIPVVSSGSVVFLAVLGAAGAWIGGARLPLPTIRVVACGVLAMVITAGVGALFGSAA